MTLNIKTVYFANYSEAQSIHANLEGIGTQYGLNFMFSALQMDLSDEDLLQGVLNSDYQLVVVHQSVQGFSVDLVNRLANSRGKGARVVAAWVSHIGDVFSGVERVGAVPYELPFNSSSFENLAANFEPLLSQAQDRIQNASPVPETPPLADHGLPVYGQVVQAGEVSRISHRTVTTWTSKGGEGKSEVTGALAYILAMLGGRKTLLVDADMNRGYFGLIVNKEARSFAAHKNITALGNLFHQTGKLPPLREFVYNYPNPFTGNESKLDILFGTRSARQASETAFNVENGDYFIKSLLEATNAGDFYEVVIFDIGTLIQHPVHVAVLKYVSNILILTAPDPGSFVPTTRGIKDLVDLDVTDLSKMKLVINTFSKGTPLSEEEIKDHFYFGNPPRTIPHIATLPAVERSLMDRVHAYTMLSPEAWLTDPKEFDGLGELVRQYIHLGELFFTGLGQYSAKTNAQVAELLGQKKAGIFARLKR